MLLRFKGSNFKSFGEEFDFFMQPQTRMKELKDSILHEQINNKDVLALSTSVIYGPNAAGKTSLVNAMSCFRSIVLRGNINNAEDDRTQDHVSNDMTLIPFKSYEEEKPVSFDITFTHNKTKYKYKLEFCLGLFFQKNKKRYICLEQLFIDDNLIYERTEKEIKTLDTSKIKSLLNIGYKSTDDDKTKKMMSSNITEQSLLLVTDFNSFCSKKIVNEITEWFSKLFIVINSSNLQRFVPNMSLLSSEILVDPYINKIAKEAGIFGSEFAYTTDNETHSTKLVSILGKGDNALLSSIDADRIESTGTMRLVYIMPAILIALKTGATLVMDEFDASLHPSIVMNIISLFHNDEVNKNNAQIIFNSQNPIYLNNRLLRRDEIKFVERDKESGLSQLYALSDFKTNDGKASVRKTSDYLKNYFVSRYGAIIDVDFTDIVLELLNSKKEIENE